RVSGHTRTDSDDSEDPLSWRKPSYNEEITMGGRLVRRTLDNTHIGWSSAGAWSECAWNVDCSKWGRF
ncbi:hypothetical protein DL98DRAFT_364774, partial [Cadophora sp. DSE1049]